MTTKRPLTPADFEFDIDIESSPVSSALMTAFEQVLERQRQIIQQAINQYFTLNFHFCPVCGDFCDSLDDHCKGFNDFEHTALLIHNS